MADWRRAGIFTQGLGGMQQDASRQTYKES
jgi:hypothetical protein